MLRQRDVRGRSHSADSMVPTMAVDVRARRVDLLITSDTMPLVGTRLAKFRLVFLSSFFFWFCFFFFFLYEMVRMAPSGSTC